MTFVAISVFVIFVISVGLLAFWELYAVDHLKRKHKSQGLAYNNLGGVWVGTTMKAYLEAQKEANEQQFIVPKILCICVSRKNDLRMPQVKDWLFSQMGEVRDFIEWTKPGLAHRGHWWQPKLFIPGLSQSQLTFEAQRQRIRLVNMDELERLVDEQTLQHKFWVILDRFFCKRQKWMKERYVTRLLFLLTIVTGLVNLFLPPLISDKKPPQILLEKTIKMIEVKSGLVYLGGDTIAFAIDDSSIAIASEARNLREGDTAYLRPFKSQNGRTTCWLAITEAEVDKLVEEGYRVSLEE